MFNIFRKLKSYNLILFLILGFCLTSQISISCEAQFLKKEKIAIENNDIYFKYMPKNKNIRKKDKVIKTTDNPFKILSQLNLK